METLNYLWIGFAVALTPMNLFYVVVGCFMGTLIGVLPGIGPAVSIAILLTVTSGMETVTALIMLAGIYYGSAYGGSTSAILINIPGEAMAVPTTLDGYQLARQGRAGPALGMAAISSFFAGTISIVLLMLLAPPLASFALDFGPPEYFALILLGLTMVVGLAGKSLAKGIISGLLGMMFAMVGLDPLTGQRRFTLGSTDLLAGIDFISVVVGLFAIPEVLSNIEQGATEVYKTRLGSVFPTIQDLKQSAGALVRGSAIGFFIGLLPGAGPAVASFLAYDIEKKSSRHPERFGKGAIEGVAAPEGANNAAIGGGMVPLLTLGIPVTPSLAVLLGAFIMHGIQPGPLLFEQNPQLVWGLIASMYIGNIVLLVLNLPLVGLWAKLCEVPYPLVAPVVLALCFVGSYGVRNNLMDVWIAIACGILGYMMQKYEYPTAPLILGLILSPMLENNLRRSLTISNGSWAIFGTRPISLILLLSAVASAAFSIYSRRKEGIVSRASGSSAG